MKQYNVSMVINVPDKGATEREVQEWVEYEVGYRGDVPAV